MKEKKKKNKQKKWVIKTYIKVIDIIMYAILVYALLQLISFVITTSIVFWAYLISIPKYAHLTNSVFLIIRGVGWALGSITAVLTYYAIRGISKWLYKKYRRQINED